MRSRQPDLESFRMQKTLTTLTIIFTAFLFSSLIYVILGFFILRLPWRPLMTSSTIIQVIFGTFLVISISILIVVLKLRQNSFSDQMPRPETSEHLRRYILTKSIIMFALAEVPSILGLVFFLISGNLTLMLILCLISAAGFLLARPSPETLERLERRFSF